MLLSGQLSNSNFLAEWHPIHTLSLKQLTLKTLSLIALSSSDRGQMQQLLNIENTHISNKDISFIIFERLITTKRIFKTTWSVMYLIRGPITEGFVLAFLYRTIPLRANSVTRGFGKPTQLFLYWPTHRYVKNRLYLVGQQLPFHCWNKYKNVHSTLIPRCRTIWCKGKRRNNKPNNSGWRLDQQK